jgi:hypothetical protein
MKSWIIAETYHNRKEDSKHNFNYLGLHKLTQLKKNIENKDLIFTYVSKIMKFSDMREVTDNTLIPLPETFKYERQFDTCIKTRILKDLKETNWISAKDIFLKLNAFKKISKFNLILINAPIKLDQVDSEIIQSYFNKY